MDILSFDVCGKLAHFRKYYANNTAFTYSMPPRTTVMGMLAAIMGYERDQYYERFASQHLRIGVRVLRPVKKTFHRLNFLSIKSLGDAIEGSGDFTGAGGHIQTPFEMVSGLHPGLDWVGYRIFIAPGEQDNGAFDLLHAALEKREQHYNLTMGVANFNAWIEKLTLNSGIQSLISDGLVDLHSAVPSDKVGRLDFSKGDYLSASYNYLEEDMMPADFIGNDNRILSKLVRVIYSTEGKPFSAEVTGPYFPVPDKDGVIQNILFIE